MRTIHKTLVVIGLLLLAPAAAAHTVGAHDAGFAAGVLHPLIGWDHLLAAIGIGLWAGWLGGHAQWRMPLAFGGGVASGASLAWVGVSLPLVEPMIGMSVLLFGALAASARRPSLLIVATVFLFASFQGHAHAAELPQAAQPALYLLGLLLASTLVQFISMRVSSGLRSARASVRLRVCGGAA